jgi:hypothetical protein
MTLLPFAITKITDHKASGEIEFRPTGCLEDRDKAVLFPAPFGD